MTIIKKIALLLFVSFLFIQCSNDDAFFVGKGKVGLLTKKTTVKELNQIFENDSIVTHLSKNNTSNKNLYFTENDLYEVYSKTGEKLLEICPIQQNDATSKLKSIQIFNPQYETKNGIGLKSTFKDISSNYVINKVETTLSSATLYIDELNATIAIDKKDLGISSFSREEILVDQIPDVSNIKFFTIWFN